MNIQHSRQNNFVSLEDHHMLAELQVRRRQLLGLLLIFIGSLWFGLRLMGVVGDPHLPLEPLGINAVEAASFHYANQFQSAIWSVVVS